MKLSRHGMLRRLNHVKRCSLFPLVNPCSVAEHSFQAALMAHMFAIELESIGVDIDIYNTLVVALYHDVEESVTSDIPWTVKRHLRVETEFDKSIDSLVTETLSNHSKHLASAAIHKCDGSLEWLVVKFCDMLELLHYCAEEYNTGNRHLKEMGVNGVSEVCRLFQKIDNHIGDLHGSDYRHAFHRLATVKEFDKLVYAIRSQNNI